MLPAPEIIATDRLLLRRPLLSDAEALFEYGRDPDVTRYMDWPTHTGIETALEFLGAVPLAGSRAPSSTGSSPCHLETRRLEESLAVYADIPPILGTS